MVPIDFRLVDGTLLDLVFPPRCVCCRSGGDYWCGDCRKEIPLITPPFV